MDNLYLIFTNLLNLIIASNPMVFYPLIIIILCYSAAFLLSRNDPKNRSLLLLISIPILVSIVNILQHSYEQVSGIITNYNTFKIFLLSHLMLVIGGLFHNFQVKYLFVSHLISGPLHICFYLYSQQNEAAGIIATLFTPTLSYLGLLGFVYFTVSHFILKKIQFDLIGNCIDDYLPTNKCKSHKMVVLLQSYIMIFHMSFITFIDKWFDYSVLSFCLVLTIAILQLFLIAINLRIFNKYPASANVPFYVSAHLMIVKLLVDQIVQYYQIYKSSQTFSLQPMCLSNRLIILSLCLFISCVLNGGVAYASDRDEVESAVTEGQSAARYARTGGTFAGGAVSYEMVSMGREYFENQGELSEQGEELNSKLEECIAAKNVLNNIDYKLRDEHNLIRTVDIYLKRVQEDAANADVVDLREYKNKIENYTTTLKSRYETYEAFKSHRTHQMYRRLFGVNSCCCSGPAVKES